MKSTFRALESYLPQRQHTPLSPLHCTSLSALTIMRVTGKMLINNVYFPMCSLQFPFLILEDKNVRVGFGFTY